MTLSSVLVRISGPVLAFYLLYALITGLKGGVASGRRYRLTRNAAKDTAPAWSSDGQQIAFISDRDGDPDIYTVSSRDLLDGAGRSRPQQITHGGATEGEPAWSPDGRYLAYARRGQIHLQDTNGSPSRTLLWGSTVVLHREISWSPDAQYLAYDGGGEGIHVIAIDGGDPRYIASGSSPAWSPDGKRQPGCICGQSGWSGFGQPDQARDADL
jgi:TolB protein